VKLFRSSPVLAKGYAWLTVGFVTFLITEALGGITLAPGPLVSPSSVPSGAPLGNLDPASLQREFERAQAKAMSALIYKQKHETDELKTSQKARRKDWVEKEKLERHKFLAEKHEGPEIRTYMRDYQTRLKALDKMLADERSQRASENAARFDAEKKDQASRHKEFMEFVARGEHPPDRLWPGN
jgi:hypothetical protein